MDPQATWKLLLDTYADGDRHEAREAAENLLAWLERGGFPPQVLPDRPMDDAWNQTIARAACQIVMRRWDLRSA
jgi:5,10-methenyltetrahydromethanopterin hydrogenase